MTDSRSGRSSFDSKLISLLPLDEVPVHVHHFAARVPCDSEGSECQCGIHRAETASALRSRKTEGAAKEKSTQSHNFFSTCRARLPERRQQFDPESSPPARLPNAKNQQGHIRHWLHPAVSVLNGECLAGNAEVNLF